jgi:hypothetical protein
MGLLYIISLSIAAGAVSILGAGFSISGLSRLFSGAPLWVAMMAGSLEFSKFVLAAFIHRTWKQLNIIYRTYLLVSIVILSVITSMGIFGFLSDAYQTSSATLNEAQLRIEALKGDQERNKQEIARITRGIDEIPASRVSKKIQARKEAEPMILELTRKTEQIANSINEFDIKILEIKNKVGPLIYVSRAFKIDVDTVVKYLILIFVSVFDPLAICLVIAAGEASRMRASEKASARIQAAATPSLVSAPASHPTTSAGPTMGPQDFDAPPLVSPKVEPEPESVVRMRIVEDLPTTPQILEGQG